ncbi:hypothetical protein EYF80_016427 [Liparis tanakae]|uniref:Uncharacterized protein n=1 Tax=Liparis tanakae TaxID=230148 RepID=A0A4Z2I7G4_9TELE|nr:hypothetical protein EYF80_016427 [Liparis tanakae]
MCSSDCLSAVFPPPKNSHRISPDSSPLPPNNPSILPPPLPLKSRDLMPLDSPQPNLPQLVDRPPESPPPLSRSGTARVSFREPISSSYSGDENEEEDENEPELPEGMENLQEEDEMEEGFGSRLHLQKGVPPKMDLLGAERHSRHSRPDRPRLDTLDWRGEKERDKRGSAAAGSLTLQPGQRKHEDSCSTCSSSSDSEDDGFFLGQPIPLPPQLRKQRPEEGQDREGDGEREGPRDWGVRGSLRRRRAHSLGAKDKDKNCAIS